MIGLTNLDLKYNKCKNIDFKVYYLFIITSFSLTPLSGYIKIHW